MAAALVAGVAPGAPASGPPPEDSPAGALATARLAVVVAALVPPDRAAVQEAVARASARCGGIDGGAACEPDRVRRCRDALGALFDALADVVAGDGDPLAVDLARTARRATGDAASRVARLHDAAAGGRCATLGAPAGGGAPARVLPGPAGSFEVRPLRALRAGRAYALVATGLSPEELATLRSSPGLSPGGDGVPPRLRSAVSATDVLTRYDAQLAGRDVRFDGDAARGLVRRIAAAATSVAGLGAGAGLTLDLGRPLTSRDLATLRLAFVPARAAPPADTVVRFRTPDVRGPFSELRARLRARGCGGDAHEGPARRAAPERDESATLSPADVQVPGAALVLRGVVPSLDARSTASAPAPATALPPSVPFLLALPQRFTPETPVVLLVHGHASSAAAFLRAQAPGLLERGMAALAVDLPGHGERAAGAPFLDVLAPERLPDALRQAATDVLAAVAFARTCGFALPDGRAYRPSAVLYLGYSVGSMVGVIVRSVEPDLGATVLLAPGGEIAEWPILQVPKRLGAESYKVCRGGSRHGAWCAAGDVCPAPGVCVPDPELILLREALRFPYAHLLAGVEPMAFATERTGPASTAPLLLLAGGVDFTLTPLMATRLADAYGMRPAADGGRRGPRSRLVWRPALGHELADDPDVRVQAYDFLSAAAARSR